MNLFDPYDRATFEADTEALRRDLADRQERREAGLEPALWQTPPEPVQPPVRAPQRQETATREWAAHCRQHTDDTARGLRRDLKTREAAVMDAIGKVIAIKRAGQARRMADLERRLRAEFEAQMKGLLAGLKMAQADPDDGIVLDMSKALRARHGTA